MLVESKVQDGEIIPACVKTCPTNAIVFGNMKDENSQVYQLAHSERVFRVFEQLGTEPAVYYSRDKEDNNNLWIYTFSKIFWQVTQFNKVSDFRN